MIMSSSAGYLFIDVETVPNYDVYMETRSRPDWRFRRGFDPFSGKLITLALQFGFDGNLIILSEWENGEDGILNLFLSYAERRAEEYWRVRSPIYFVGFNTLDFILPFLYSRVWYHEEERLRKGYSSERNFLEKMERCFSLLFRRIPSIDLKQLHLYQQGLQQSFPEQRFFDFNLLRETYGLGRLERLNIADLYYNKEYNKILDYIEKKFVYPVIMKRILESGLVQATAGRER